MITIQLGSYAHTAIQYNWSQFVRLPNNDQPNFRDSNADGCMVVEARCAVKAIINYNFRNVATNLSIPRRVNVKWAVYKVLFVCRWSRVDKCVGYVVY